MTEINIMAPLSSIRELKRKYGKLHPELRLISKDGIVITILRSNDEEGEIIRRYIDKKRK